MNDPATITEVTLGEVYRLLEGQARTLTSMASSIETRPSWDDIERMEKARIERARLHAEKEATQDTAIKSLEDGNRWLVRTVGASLVTALAGLAVAASRVL